MAEDSVDGKYEAGNGASEDGSHGGTGAGGGSGGACGIDNYDEAFICRAAAIAHARSRSVSEVAASLSIPAELLETWKKDYAGKIKVRFIDDVRVRSKHRGIPFFSKPAKGKSAPQLERCPECGSDVVFEPVKGFEVLREEGVDIGTSDSIMNSGDDGIFGIEIPYVKVTTELIARCPVCGLYTIQNITEKLTNSGV